MITENGLCWIIAFPFHLSPWSFIQRLLMSPGCAQWVSGSKCQGHNAVITENGLCRIISLPLYLSSWNFIQRLPMRWGCALLILGSKGQRSRSQCIDNLKWFMLHNCCPFTFIIIKLHTKTLHELRMCPTGFGVKRSRSQCIDNWKWLMLYNCFPFTSIIIKLHTKTLHELRMCPMGFGVKRSKVKSHAMIQSRLSYATLQGTLMKRSHMTGGLLIQSPTEWLRGQTVYDFLTFSKSNQITGCVPMLYSTCTCTS